jgi:hypothetical protein
MEGTIIMKRTIFFVITVMATILTACGPSQRSIQTAIAQTQVVEIPTISSTKNLSPTIKVEVTYTATSEDCSQSNPVVANWLRETEATDTLSVAALQEADDLYSNPRETGKQDALDWQERTLQAYDFMLEYQPIPQCLITYHNLETEMLYQLSLTFSELALVYIAIDANQDFEPSLRAAKQHLVDALDASIASVEEWTKVDRLMSQILPASEVINSTPTNLPGQISSEDSSCTKKNVNSYLDDAATVMERANQLAYDFNQTQNRDQTTDIVIEMDDIWKDVMLWQIPNCATDVHTNLMMITGKFSSMQHAILNDDMDSYYRDYAIYEIALGQLNAEAIKLEESVQ